MEERYKPEFRAEVARLVIDGGRSCAEVARVHSLDPSLVAYWVRQARLAAGDNPKEQAISAEKAENIRLRRALETSER